MKDKNYFPFYDKKVCHYEITPALLKIIATYSAGANNRRPEAYE